MNRIARIVLCILAVLGGLAGFLLVGQHGFTVLGAHEGSQENWWLRALLCYGLTLAGVVFGGAYRELLRLRDRGDTKVVPRRFVRNLVGSFELWLGLFGSPIVFMLVLNSTDGVGTAGLATIAIQNGFFCTVIVSGLRPPAVNGQTPTP